ncbi:peptidase [Tenacibaculum sp. E3R01]|uniref:zinc-dependent metalloprotease n=1 Tax=Tenacibaculum sp. E3R01 TaxID=2267227 RepID=UPI000DEA4D8B|nr:zinc-dependent metalloprotease [Tenacibaculum sp. E3R01]RBW63198.1 peptidase [Tenacibaculum sp. E3R01]
MKKLTTFILFFCVTFSGFSQFFEGNKEVTKYKGYFTFYYDESNDKIFLEVTKLNNEFLYVNSLSEGLGSNDIGLDRGQLGNSVVVKFLKAGNKLLLIQPNQDYRAITSNKEEKESVKEAFAKSVLYGFKIKESKKNKYLVDATGFFMRDAHGVTNTLARNKEGSYRLDKSKSAFNLGRTKAFPKNVEFDIMLTFSGKPKGYNVRSVAPNASLITVHQHHSFVELPDNNYTPRKYDPRCGSWQMTYMDYATPVNEPIKKRFITRHRLEKKNPSAAISEAKEPIIYYLDRGTPEPVRSALLEGGSWWNQAFEAAGYKNAFQIKMLPEGVDPLDVRYNMVQWVHRSTRGWSYGGSITDPRTGEIIKGHVSLGSLRIRQDFLIAQALQAPYKNNTANDSFALDMALARIRQLSAHEIGHTLGFAHNFAASTNGRSSVMDYPHPKLSLKNGAIDFSEAYDTKIGIWDKVTVAYAYQDFESNEESNLNKILENAFAQGLRFITDSDSRSKGSAHAYAHLWDNGESASDELDTILEIRAHAIQSFSIDNIKSKQPYSVLEDVFVPLYYFHRYQVDATSKTIGGLDYTYAVKGQKEKVVERVSGKAERKALKSLLKTIDVEKIGIPKKILTLFPPRAYGYYRTRESFKSKTGVAFDPYGAMQTATEFTLSFLLHPERINRLIQHKNLDESQLGLSEVLDKLITKTFKRSFNDSYYKGLNEMVKEEVLKGMFSIIVDKNIYSQAKAITNNEINKLVNYLTKKNKNLMDIQYLEMIQDFKKNPLKYKKQRAPKMPDGSPIGTRY